MRQKRISAENCIMMRVSSKKKKSKAANHEEVFWSINIGRFAQCVCFVFKLKKDNGTDKD